jgi:hypothetical protein
LWKSKMSPFNIAPGCPRAGSRPTQIARSEEGAYPSNTHNEPKPS